MPWLAGPTTSLWNVETPGRFLSVQPETGSSIFTPLPPKTHGCSQVKQNSNSRKETQSKSLAVNRPASQAVATWGALLTLLPGETIKIVIEEYVQQLSGYFLQLKFDPELLFGVQFQYQNRIAVEFNHLYHWHPLMPDSFKVGSQDYSYEQFLFNTSMLVDNGVEALVDAFSRQSAGRVSLEGALGIRQTWIQVPVFFSEI